MTSVRIFRMNPKRDDDKASVRPFTKEDIKRSISTLRDFCSRYKCNNDHESEKENAEVMKTVCDPEFLKDQTESIEVINKNLEKCGLIHVG